MSAVDELLLTGVSWRAPLLVFRLRWAFLPTMFVATAHAVVRVRINYGVRVIRLQGYRVRATGLWVIGLGI